MNKYVLGLDIGYGGLKLVGGLPDFQVPKEGGGLFVKRSTAAPAAVVNEGLNGATESHTVLVGDIEYKTCFDPARTVSNCQGLQDDYSNTPGYKALFHTALDLTGQDCIDVLVTGLPVKVYNMPGMREKLVAMMQGTHHVQRGKKVTVKKVVVLPQPYGGWLVFYYDHAEGVEPSEMSVVVVDPGAYSVDWSVFAKGNPLRELNDSSMKASHTILNRAVQLIREENAGADLRSSDLESQLMSGRSTIYVRGKAVVYEKYLSRAVDEIVPDVVRELVPKIRQGGRSPDRIVLVGGGASFYRKPLEAEYGTDVLVMPERPAVANAQGFYYYGCQSLVDK